MEYHSKLNKSLTKSPFLMPLETKVIYNKGIHFNLKNIKMIVFKFKKLCLS